MMMQGNPTGLWSSLTPQCPTWRDPSHGCGHQGVRDGSMAMHKDSVIALFVSAKRRLGVAVEKKSATKEGWRTDKRHKKKRERERVPVVRKLHSSPSVLSSLLARPLISSMFQSLHTSSLQQVLDRKKIILLISICSFSPLSFFPSQFFFFPDPKFRTTLYGPHHPAGSSGPQDKATQDIHRRDILDQDSTLNRFSASGTAVRASACLQILKPAKLLSLSGTSSMTATPSSANGSHHQQQQPQQQQQQPHLQQSATASGTSSKKSTVRLGSPSNQPTLSAASWGAARKPSNPHTMAPSPSEPSQEAFAPQPLSTPSVSVHPVHGLDSLGPTEGSVSSHSPEPSKEPPQPTSETALPTTMTTATTKSHQVPKLRVKRSLEGLGPVVHRQTSTEDDDNDYKGKATANSARSAKRRHHERRSASAGLGKALDGNISGGSSSSSGGNNHGNNNKRSRDPNAPATVKKTKMADHREIQGFPTGKGPSPGVQE